MFDFSRFPTMSTKNLILREITVADAKSVFELRSDYQVTRFNNASAYTVLQQAYDLIVGFREDFRSKNTIRWGITLKNESKIIGIIGYNYWAHVDSRASVGYDLAKAYWGNGYTSEALKMILVFGFHQMMLNRVEAESVNFNVASIRVLEKAGFVQEGRQREKFFQGGQFYDLLLYALLRREYLQRQSTNGTGTLKLPDNWTIN